MLIVVAVAVIAVAVVVTVGLAALPMFVDVGPNDFFIRLLDRGLGADQSAVS